MDEATPTPGQVVGRNVARYRSARGETQAEFAEVLKAHRVPISLSALAWLEAGKREDVTVSELALLGHILKVTPADLLASDQPVRLAAGVSAPPFEMSRYFGAEGPLILAFEARAEDENGAYEMLKVSLDRHHREAEKLADRIGVSKGDIWDAAHDLWDCTVTQERDRRTRERVSGQGADLSPRVVRGHVTRELEAELRAHFEQQRRS